MQNPDSVHVWLAGLRKGDEVAAQRLWDNYFARLVNIASSRLPATRRLPVDAEDVALSALQSLCAAMRQERFAELSDRDSLWKLLVAITVRKAGRAVRDECRLKRGSGRLVGESALASADKLADEASGLEQILDTEPTPEFVIQMEEEIQVLLNMLPDDELRRIAMWKMQGMTSSEVAAGIGKALATVERRLKLIRAVWEDHFASNGEQP